MGKGKEVGIRTATYREISQHERLGHSRHYIYSLSRRNVLPPLAGIQQVMTTVLKMKGFTRMGFYQSWIKAKKREKLAHLNDLSKNPMGHLWAFFKKTNRGFIESVKMRWLRVVTTISQTILEMKIHRGNDLTIVMSKLAIPCQCSTSHWFFIVSCQNISTFPNCSQGLKIRVSLVQILVSAPIN